MRYFSTTLFFPTALLCALIFFAGSLDSRALDGDFVWAQQMGGTGAELASGVALDSTGNIYTAGQFQGTVDFDPGAGMANLTSLGFVDIFVSKLDSSGAFVWAKQMGGFLSGSGAEDIAVDGNGNVYITGAFNGTVDFDPDAGTSNLTSPSGDIFVCKLDNSGVLVWARQMGGSSSETGYGIAVDVTTGDVLTTGFFQGTADFDPGAGTVNLVSLGVHDIYVSSLDSSGAFLWARSVGGTGNDEGNGIGVDSAGNVYVTGFFTGGPVNFVVANLTATLRDAFIYKLDALGVSDWAGQLGGAGNDMGLGIAVDTSGDIYTTGAFENSAMGLTATGGSDIFVAKLDTAGAFDWARQFGGVSTDIGYATVVRDGNVYTAGSINSGSNDDIFVSKVTSSAGILVWSKQMGGTSVDRGSGVVVASDNSVYTVGFFSSTVDFDPGAGTANLLSFGGNDIFALKLSGPDTVVPVFSNLAVNINPAQANDSILISFEVSETLLADPTVTVNGNTAAFAGAVGNSYTYSYQVTTSDLAGFATIDIAGQDISGNPGLLSNNTILEIIVVTTVPLALWPGLLALAGAGALALRRRRH